MEIKWKLLPFILLYVKLTFGQNVSRLLPWNTPSKYWYGYNNQIEYDPNEKDISRTTLHPGVHKPPFSVKPITYAPPPTLPTKTNINEPIKLWPQIRCNDTNTDVILNFSGLGLKKLGKHFIRSPEVRELYLENNEIQEISPLAFNELSRLEVLNLSGNNLTVNRLLWFGNCQNLKKFILDDNKYTGDDTSIDDIFQSAPKLQNLSLQRNRITKISVSLYTFAPRLVQLDLSGNSISTTDFLNDSPSTLIYLYLNSNSISTLKVENQATVELSLSKNKIEQLCGIICNDHSLSLDGMTRLKKLNLSGNIISEIADDALKDAKSLVTLDLSFNKIRSLPDKLFEKSISLQELILSYNHFVTIPNLCSLRYLQLLDLRGNKLEAVTKGMLCSHAMSLEKLLLANNHITNVDGEAVFNLPRLSYLDLSHNFITDMPISLISVAKNLQVLLLNNNSILKIDDLFNTNSSSLQEVHLQNNPLSSIRFGLRCFYGPTLVVHVIDSIKHDDVQPDIDDKDNDAMSTEQNDYD